MKTATTCLPMMLPNIGSKIFISCPYTGYEEVAINLVSDVYFRLMTALRNPVAPMLSVEFAVRSANCESNNNYWFTKEEHKELMYKMCLNNCLSHIDRTIEKMFVLKLGNWESSSGVRKEIEKATELGIPIAYLPVSYKDEESSTVNS